MSEKADPELFKMRSDYELYWSKKHSEDPEILELLGGVGHILGPESIRTHLAYDPLREIGEIK